MKEKIAKLCNVKSIVTITLTGVFSALALLVHTFVYWIVFVAAQGVHGGGLLLTFCLPSVLYTVIFTPLWFLITRGISRLLPSEVKR